MSPTKSKDAVYWPADRPYPQNDLLQLIDALDIDGLSNFISNTLPQLSTEIQEAYTALPALQSDVSQPAHLLMAAARAQSPQIFKFLWDALYAPHNVGEAEALSNSHTPVKIPWACLIHAAQRGSIPLARVFVICEPAALARVQPPVAHGRRSGSQILSAMRAGNLEYIDFMRAHGVDLNHEWPRIRVLRVAVGLEQSDDELEAKLRFLVDRGVRIKGAGALRQLARYGIVEAAKVLLDNGADVEDLGEEELEGETYDGKPVESAMMGAVREGNVEMVKLLLERGADANQKNHQGETPLSVAETKGMDLILAALRHNK
ncbi:hypothetical protein G7Z17_g1786 [Cylindrodendrum hubeiense]|uniref:Ankyrin n=1 Tax=Cylindrodendrum hubeiense TaxID=595255 RepID=A0A9P5LLR8_9HYPO|nr:hypothetical protein G7Z17_g1786 [Cylindrodendrum hubeiense]